MNTEMLRKAVIPASVGVIGLSVGGGLGYILGLRKARRNYMHLVQEAEERNPDYVDPRDTHPSQLRPYPVMEVVSLDVPHDFVSTERMPYYTVPQVAEILEQAPVLPDPELEALLEEEAELIYSKELERQNKNVFVDGRIYDASDDEWNWEAELNQRSDKTIYVITYDEFKADDMGYRQSSLNFYEGDRRVCDELGEPIYNWTAHIGTEIPFGHGSQDENIVFIRNESLKWEYEVNKIHGRFDTEVEGYDVEDSYNQQDLKHAHAPMKMRRE